METDWQPYIEGLRRRANAERQELRLLKEQSLALAKEVAGILRERFSATKVVLFGSLIRDDFNLYSDIDIAVWGLPDEMKSIAMDTIEKLSTRISLVAMSSSVKPSIAKEIEETGVEL